VAVESGNFVSERRSLSTNLITDRRGLSCTGLIRLAGLPWAIFTPFW